MNPPVAPARSVENSIVPTVPISGDTALRLVVTVQGTMVKSSRSPPPGGAPPVPGLTFPPAPGLPPVETPCPAPPVPTVCEPPLPGVPVVPPVPETAPPLPPPSLGGVAGPQASVARAESPASPSTAEVPKTQRCRGEDRTRRRRVVLASSKVFMMHPRKELVAEHGKPARVLVSLGIRPARDLVQHWSRANGSLHSPLR